jgi:hypothetical protein
MHFTGAYSPTGREFEDLAISQERSVYSAGCCDAIKFPLESRANPADGLYPSVQFGLPATQKLWSVVRVPPVVMLNAVPPKLVPPWPEPAPGPAVTAPTRHRAVLPRIEANDGSQLRLCRPTSAPPFTALGSAA